MGVCELKNRLALMLILGGVICHVSFNMIGSEVDIDGVLREPFPLLPLGYLLYLFGVGLYVWHWISGWKRSTD